MTNLLGVTMKCETKIVRRTWEMVIRNGVSVARLKAFLLQIPDDASITDIYDHEHDETRTVIEFEQEIDSDSQHAVEGQTE